MNLPYITDNHTSEERVRGPGSVYGPLYVAHCKRTLSLSASRIRHDKFTTANIGAGGQLLTSTLARDRKFKTRWKLIALLFCGNTSSSVKTGRGVQEETEFQSTGRHCH